MTNLNLSWKNCHYDTTNLRIYELTYLRIYEFTYLRINVATELPLFLCPSTKDT